MALQSLQTSVGFQTTGPHYGPEVTLKSDGQPRGTICCEGLSRGIYKGAVICRGGRGDYTLVEIST